VNINSELLLGAFAMYLPGVTSGLVTPLRPLTRLSAWNAATSTAWIFTCTYRHFPSFG